jgi:muconolactone delta-isomerase
LLYAFIGRPTAKLDGGDPLSDLNDVIEAERAKTVEYRALGVLQGLWLFAGHDGALLLCNADSREEAQAISDAYPMVQAGYVTHQIYELRPDTVGQPCLMAG